MRDWAYVVFHMPPRYVNYREKPISITDVLSLTLAFVRDEKMWDHEDPKGAEQAEKRARTSLYPSPRYRSEMELSTMEACLTRWGEELSQDMEGRFPWVL
jgi:hypothetical protein